jgi:hypothetical protein
MPPSGSTSKLSGMSYAVAWSENAGPKNVGRLELTANAIRLIGSLAKRLGLADLISARIERRCESPWQRRPVLVLVDRDGTTIELCSLQGLGALLELADDVLDARAQAAA